MEIVHDKPEEGHRLNIEGEKGGSLFHHPVTRVIEEDFKRINEQYERYWKLIDEAQDERLLALISALSIEDALDLFLEAYIPKYRHLFKENKDFTLSMKIDLAYSLCLIPMHILNAADLVRKIRNEFVHNLSIDCFDSLDDDRFKNKLGVRFKEFYPDDTNTGLTHTEMFKRVVVGIIVALGIYASHLRTAKEYIYGEDFRSEFNKRIKGKAS